MHNNYCSISDFVFFNIFTASALVTDPVQAVQIAILESLSIVLNCSAVGVPAANVMWYQGETRLIGVEDRTAIHDGSVIIDTEGYIRVSSTLTISQSSRLDSNVYSCEAENTVLDSLRMDRRFFNVTVDSKD